MNKSWVVPSALWLAVAFARLVYGLLLLFRPVVVLMTLPAGIMLAVMSMVMGFWGQTPHFYEQRWTMLALAGLAIGTLVLYEGVTRWAKGWARRPSPPWMHR